MGDEPGVTQSEERAAPGALELSLAVSPLAQLIIGRDGSVVAASPRACELLGVPAGSKGMSFASLVSSEAAHVLLTLVDRAFATDEPATFVDESWDPVDGQPSRLNGGVVPLKDQDGVAVAAAVTVDPIDGVADQLVGHNDELRRDNTELRSIADELRTRTVELNVVAVFLQSVLTSLRGAVVVIDTDSAIRVWNAEAERLWAVPRRIAVRSRLSELDLGFEQSLLTASIRRGLRGEVSEDLALVGVRADGADAAYTASVTPLLGPGATVHGVTMLFVERRDR